MKPIDIVNAKDGQLEVTLRGKAEDVIQVLVGGLPEAYRVGGPRGRLTRAGMRMSDVRVGMRLRSIFQLHDEITVTEITARGFKYSLDCDKPLIPRWGMTIAKDGHEHFGHNGECLYELVEAGGRLGRIIAAALALTDELKAEGRVNDTVKALWAAIFIAEDQTITEADIRRARELCELYPEVFKSAKPAGDA